MLHEPWTNADTAARGALIACLLAGCTASSTTPADASIGSDTSTTSADGPVNDAGLDTLGDSDAAEIPGLLWGYHKPNGQPHLRSTLALANQSAFAWTGGFYGGGKLFLMEGGNGVPLWEFEKPGSFGVAAAQSTNILYGAWHHEDDMGKPLEFQVAQFSTTSAAPVWTYDALAAGYTNDAIDAQGQMGASSDGSVLAVIANKGDKTNLLFFAKDNGVPRGVYEHPTAGRIRQLRLTADGSVATIHIGPEVLRIDVARGAKVGAFTVGASTDAFAASDDGSVVLHGFFDLQVLRWNGSSYEKAWSHRLDGKATVGAVGIAQDNETILAGWTLSSGTSFQSTVTRYGRSKGQSPLWTFSAKPGAGKYGDSAAWISLSSDGGMGSVAWWGTEDNANPEMMVFQDSSPEKIYYSIDLPGSAYAALLSADGRYLAGVGKGVHTSQLGNGGSVVAAKLKP